MPAACCTQGIAGVEAMKRTLLLATVLGTMLDVDVFPPSHRPQAPEPTPDITPFPKNDKMRAAEAKRERRRKRGW